MEIQWCIILCTLCSSMLFLISLSLEAKVPGSPPSRAVWAAPPMAMASWESLETSKKKRQNARYFSEMFVCHSVLSLFELFQNSTYQQKTRFLPTEEGFSLTENAEAARSYRSKMGMTQWQTIAWPPGPLTTVTIGIHWMGFEDQTQKEIHREGSHIDSNDWSITTAMP